MVSRSTFTSKLTRDPKQRAEAYFREGRKQKAAEMYARAGDHRQAARLAAEAGDERLAVESSLRAAFPDGVPAAPPTPPAPPAPGGAPTEPGLRPQAGARPPQPLQPSPALQSLQPLQAAELLADHGHYDLAVGLFELARSFRRAALAAIELRQPGRAGRLFERGRSYADAAVQYENAELLEDALRVLEIEGKRLEEAGRTGGAHQEQQARLDLRRAELLRKMGKSSEAAALLREVRPSAQAVRLLEESGRYREAIETALQMNDAETAVRLLHRAPDIDRQLAAQIYLRSGHALEAGNLFAGLGLAREAAAAYEAGGDWAKAGSRWETAQEHERAAEAYVRARRPRDAGRCFAAVGKVQQAAAAFSRAGDHTAAAAQYLKARQRVAAAAELLAGGDREQAAKVLLQVADGGPEHETATLQLVPLLLEQGQAEEALRRLRQLPPARLPAAHTLGTPQATERAQAARERLYWLGRAYEQLGKLDQAESCYRELADPTAEHRDALARLVEVRQRLRPGSPDLGLTAQSAAVGATIAAPVPSSRWQGITPRASTVLSAPAAGPAAAAAPGPAAPAAPPGASGPTPAAPAAGATGAAGRLTPTAPLSNRPPAPGAAAGRGGAIGTLAVGQVLAGRFQILAELGQGGMGRVYKALDFELGEEVAIKMLLGQPDDGSVDAERLLREVQICRRITHPNVVRVFDLGRHDGWIFIIMELLEGQGLAELIDPAKVPKLARVRTILTEIASGLQEAHTLGVVHRDLKPENVILTATRLKILDFGIARMSGFDKRLTQVGFALGSPLYMSPEQIQGLNIDNRSDLYSLGVLAFALLAGREPFDGANSTAIAIQHLQQPPPDLRSLRPDVPAGWSEMIAKLLSKRPEDRYASAQEVIDVLAQLPVE